MKAKDFALAWIVVKDLKKAVQFYTETVGLKLMNMSEEWGWAELQGYEGGASLGIAQIKPGIEEAISAGQNAVPTFTFESLDQARAHVQKAGGCFKGDIQEVPGHVKMQTMVDPDGNHFQIIEKLGD